jgi:hypothetical protein
VPGSGGSTSRPVELVKDFLVDGLGILLPGLSFIFACIPALIAPLAWFIFVADAAFAGDWKENITLGKLFGSSSLKSLERGASSFHWEIFFALVASSYVIGHLLFRQDIKEPDRKSFIRAHMPTTSYSKRVMRWGLRFFGYDARFPLCWPEVEEAATTAKVRGESTRPRWFPLTIPIPVVASRNASIWGPNRGVTFDGMVRPIKDVDLDLADVKVEYPYHFLFEYLDDRGFAHLSCLVPWRGVAGKNLTNRTKHLINLLKTNIQMADSDAAHLLSKNEAHIRLASSIWYTATYILKFSILGILLCISANLITWFTWHIIKMPFMVGILLVVLLAILVKSAIEKSLHYQRCREIFLVLHTAALLGKRNPHVLYGIPKQEDDVVILTKTDRRSEARIIGLASS